jgi:3-hydroxyisobutyrate dehydrogenase
VSDISHNRERERTLGFLGLGLMGQPMALNLARSGAPLMVWNRSPEKCEPLRAAGATVASSPAEVFARAAVIFVMMVNEDATDAVLGRGTPAFRQMVAGSTVVCMSSNAPDYSRALAADITSAGGRYAEAPVSGSRKPAEAGQLVALLAGHDDVVSQVAPLLAPMCRATVQCGAVGNGLLMKLSINLVLNQLIAALAEAVHFADRHALDLHAFEAAFNAGSMGSDLTRIKIPKLVAREFTAQAATADALNSQRTIAAAARAAALATPLLDAGIQLYEETVALGHGRLDMVSVLNAIEARTAAVAASSDRLAAHDAA